MPNSPPVNVPARPSRGARILVPRLALAFTAATIALLAWGAELSPYQPPVQRATPMQRSPGSPQRSTDADIYGQFEREVRALSAEQRQELADSFARRVERALQDRNYEEAAHYSKLLSILGR